MDRQSRSSASPEPVIRRPIVAMGGGGFSSASDLAADPPASVSDVNVVIFHAASTAQDGPLVQAVTAARAALAERHLVGFRQAGATNVRIIAGPPDAVPFGARLRGVAAGIGPGGLVVLGSGAVPLLALADRRRFVAVAAADGRLALANNRYSADIVAIATARPAIAALPDLATDNILPRWLAESAGYDIADLRGRWRLGVDIDGPLDLVMLGPRWSSALPTPDVDRVTARIGAIRSVVADPGAELVVTGRTSPEALAWLTRAGAARTRALVEERGLRTGVPGQRPPASALGALLDRDGPGSLGEHLERLGEAALVDSRVLLAHRLGRDERAWPPPEDRFASDLLLHERIADPWLRDLTMAAADARIPVLLGGHTLVGPGLRLVLGRR